MWVEHRCNIGGTHAEFTNVKHVWNINNGATNLIIHLKLLPIKAMANIAKGKSFGINKFFKYVDGT
jgi:hypothetical protein